MMRVQKDDFRAATHAVQVCATPYSIMPMSSMTRVLTSEMVFDRADNAGKAKEAWAIVSIYSSSHLLLRLLITTLTPVISSRLSFSLTALRGALG